MRGHTRIWDYHIKKSGEKFSRPISSLLFYSRLSINSHSSSIVSTALMSFLRAAELG